MSAPFAEGSGVTAPIVSMPGGAPAPAPAPTLVWAEELTKTYAGTHRALLGVSLQADAGQVVGVVGPNGAGKSTMLKILATLIEPTSGRARICGSRLREVDKVRPLIGVSLQDVGLDPLMTVEEHLSIQGSLYRLRVAGAKRRAAELIDRFELGSFAGLPAGLCSGGIQRRLSLALALVNDPPVMIFDEPTVGLDPRSRRTVWDTIGELGRDGRAVVFATQYLDEADLLCDRLLLIDGGKVIASGRPAELKAQVGGPVVEVEVEDGPGPIRPLLQERLGSDEVLGEDGLGGGAKIAVRARRGAHDLARVVHIIEEGGWAIRRIALKEPTLDDVFMKMTGKAVEPTLGRGRGMDLAARTNRGGGKRWKP